MEGVENRQGPAAGMEVHGGPRPGDSPLTSPGNQSRTGL